MDDIKLGTLSLPPDLLWSDENAWLPIGATSKRAISGAEIVQLGTVKEGRPITLQGGSDFAWITYAQLQALRDMATDAATYRLLVLPDGRTFTVRFRVEELLVIEAEPVSHRVTDDPAVRDTFQYIPTIRLKTVPA